MKKAARSAILVAGVVLAWALPGCRTPSTALPAATVPATQPPPAVLSPGSVVNGLFGGPLPSEWHFQSQGQGFALVEVLFAPGAELALHLVDASGRRMATEQAHGGSVPDRLSFSLPQPGTYRLRLVSTGFSGAYAMLLTLSDGAWPATPQANLVPTLPSDLALLPLPQASAVPPLSIEGCALFGDAFLLDPQAPLPAGFEAGAALAMAYSVEEQMLARMIWNEERSEGYESMVAAGWTAVNRLNHRHNGMGSLEAVLSAPNAYFYPGRDPLTTVAADRLDHPGTRVWLQALGIGKGILNGCIPDNTFGSEYFINCNSDFVRIWNVSSVAEMEAHFRAYAAEHPTFWWQRLGSNTFVFNTWAAMPARRPH